LSGNAYTQRGLIIIVVYQMKFRARRGNVLLVGLVALVAAEALVLACVGGAKEAGMISEGSAIEISRPCAERLRGEFPEVGVEAVLADNVWRVTWRGEDPDHPTPRLAFTIVDVDALTGEVLRCETYYTLRGDKGCHA